MTDFNPTVTPLVYTKNEVDSLINKSNATTVVWSESFNLDDYKTQGIYYITGERLQSEYDNLPIMNASPGHTISGQLTVLDASLNDAEMCVTQYLKLTNRTGSEGKEYIRTYNKYSNGTEGWSVWREIKQTANLNQISDAELNNYTENGLYEGVINNGENPSAEQIARDISNFFAQLERGNSVPLPTTAFFTMEVLNNYAVVQKMSQILGEEVPTTFVQRVKCVFPTLEYVEVYRIGNSIYGFGGWTKINK